MLSIGDGDTLGVKQGCRTITVRLACIDAPEMAQRPHGQTVRDYLRMRLPIGSPVHLDVKSTDRYGRTVAEMIGEININLALAEDGQAFAYRQYLSGCDAREYLDAEFRASRRRPGVWKVSGGIRRPWNFRRSPPGYSVLACSSSVSGGLFTSPQQVSCVADAELRGYAEIQWYAPLADSD